MSTDNPASEIAEMVRQLVEEAMGSCEPENADDTASAYSRKVLTRKFTAVLSASAAEVERLRAALHTDRVTEAELKRVGRIEGIGGLLTIMQKNGWEIRRQQKSGH